ncbi:MAG: amidohydrolase family protein [Bacillota bacterium]
MSLAILIKNATIITQNPRREVFSPGYLAVDDGGRLSAVAAGEPRGLAARETIDAGGAIVFPGFINTHTHLFQVLYKGLGADLDFLGWLNLVSLPVSAALTPEACYSSALVGSLDLLHSGCTHALNYAHSNPVPGVALASLQGMQAAGISGTVARGVRTVGSAITALQEDVEVSFAEALDLRQACTDSGGLFHAWLAPAVVWALRRDDLAAVAGFARSAGFRVTMHLNETPDDNQRSIAQWGHTAIDELELHGLVDKLLAVHCVHLTDADRRRLVAAGASVSHNPIANMYLGTGVAPIPQLLTDGATVALATDGAASNNSQDMFEVVKTTALLHRVTNPGPKAVLSAQDVLDMATLAGARALGLEHELGSLEQGKRADFCVFDPVRSQRSTPWHDAVNTLVFAAGREGIARVVVAGRQVIVDGSSTLVDEAQVNQACQADARALVKKALG